MLLALRAVWRRGWNMLPAAALPFRNRLAAGVRAMVGVPTGQSPRGDGGASYRHWIARHDRLGRADRAAIRAHVARLPAWPLISIIMPVHDTPEAFLRQAIVSVRQQLYPNWELCIGDDASAAPHVSAILSEAAAVDPRIRFERRAEQAGVAAACNAALALARGEFAALMQADAVLAPHALYEVAVAIAQHPEAAIFYSDEDRIDATGRRTAPYFKPEFDPDLLLAQNLIGHFGVYRRALLTRLGGLREGLDGAEDHDLALWAVTACGDERVQHIPAILSHVRAVDQTPADAEASRRRRAQASRRAVAEALAARGLPAALEVAPFAPDYLRIIWPVPHPTPLVSVIVPTRDRSALLEACAEGVLNGTDYKRIEFLVVDNGSSEAATLELFERLKRDPRVRILHEPGPFNYAALNNRAAAEAKGEILLLLNNDIEVIDPSWLHEMVAQAIRPDVGAVGAKLLYADGTVQHGGVVTGAGGVANHYNLGAARSDPGPFGALALVRQVSAVTGACMALRKSVFDAVGGLDAENLAVAYNDVDLCLRIAEHKLRILWTPFAELYHLESVSRGFDISSAQANRFRREVEYMQRRWGARLQADPFYNPNLDLGDPNGSLAATPRRPRPWREAQPGRRAA